MGEVKVINPRQKIVLMSDLYIGEYGVVMSKSHTGHVVLKSYNQIVSLTDPSITWTTGANLEVMKLSKNTEIQIII